MKIKILFITLLFFSGISLNAQQAKSTSPAKSSDVPRPKLVVGIMVDQMRWDYLYRFYERYGNGGFKRMLNEGFSCENAYINYIPSVTGIGHTTVYTGSVPAIHGITGNDWIIQATGKTMYCAADSTVSTVGSDSESAGKMSPKNMLVTSMTDELRLATNFRSKVISIASKDRGAILPGGHTANAAYWYDGSSGNWITSTYYMKTLPTWVSNFNDQKYPEKYLKQDWNTLFPINTYLQSTKDDVPYEGKFAGMSSSTLPVKTSEMLSRGMGIITSTPHGSSLTLDLARAAVDNEGLGADAITDFLAISVSSPDYIGHQFGPNSIEVEDTYLRLDRDLAKLFSHLDTKVGKGNYTVFLSADHAVQHNSGFLADNKIATGVFESSNVLKQLNAELETEFKVKDIAKSFSNYAVSLNNAAIATNKLSESAIKNSTIEFLKKQQGVAFVVDIANAQNATIPAVYKEKIINGYHPERSGVIQIILEPAWYSGSSQRSTGATHGTMNPADTHIPMVFMGWGIKQGKTNNSYNMTDIAPTISGLLRIQEPNGNIGKAVNEALK
ncbi:Type I phosphodiesterase / nucleotide pyrophosphatase [Daejeonella rubra]|uniref:Type I phosphodiesterase / nucleotide pyrophosphatase n=1 Tax=Daejeonella rubra TaxID=990371 RepID=A0A1G9TUP3_9SPHI|nr:alkaline phosphatase PafA [Daejeonella rubra]SDM51291.1 Type I phosphodiesterase / nucleotide pyrophosphatase [Daejeonella rubra]